MPSAAGSTVTDGSSTGSCPGAGRASRRRLRPTPGRVTVRATSAAAISSAPRGRRPSRCSASATSRSPSSTGSLQVSGWTWPSSGTGAAVSVCRKPVAPSTTAVAVAVIGSAPAVCPWRVMAPSARASPVTAGPGSSSRGEAAPGAVLEPAAEQVTCHVAVDRDQGRRRVRRTDVAADGHRPVDDRRDGRGLPVDRGEHGRRVGLGRRRGYGEAQVGADAQVGLVDLRALPGRAEPEPERRRRDRGRDQHHGRARVRTPGRLLGRQRQHQARRAEGQPGGGAQQHRHQPHHDQGGGDQADHRREGERDVPAVGGRGRLAAQLPPGEDDHRHGRRHQGPVGAGRGPAPSGAGWPRTWCSCRRRSAPAPGRAPGCSRARSAPARR